MPLSRHGLKAKRILSRGNHVQRNRVTTPVPVHGLGFKPRAQTRIEYFRLALPEIRRQPALNPKVI